MQLTQFTDYSLRALIYIALRKDSCTIQDIANAYNISVHHMVKIIHHLAKLELIHTTRGKGGGITMAVAPETINIGKIIQTLEPHLDLVPCFNKEKANCCIAPACHLKKILYEAQLAFINVLKAYTLADVLHNPDELASFLHLKSISATNF